MKKYGLIIFVLIIISISTFGTVDEIYVNTITKEYQYSDNGCKGFIGWKDVDNDPSMDFKVELKLISEGYSQTTFPYKIDLFTISFLLLLTSIFIYFWKRKFTSKT